MPTSSGNELSMSKLQTNWTCKDTTQTSSQNGPDKHETTPRNTLKRTQTIRKSESDREKKMIAHYQNGQLPVPPGPNGWTRPSPPTSPLPTPRQRGRQANKNQSLSQKNTNRRELSPTGPYKKWNSTQMTTALSFCLDQLDQAKPLGHADKVRARRYLSHMLTTCATSGNHTTAASSSTTCPSDQTPPQDTKDGQEQVRST